MKRGIKKTESRQIIVWVPETLVPHIEKAVKMEDTDRSKFIRNAVREKIRRAGIVIPDPETIEENAR